MSPEMKEAQAKAQDWYAQSGKAPKHVEEGICRWVLPDPPGKKDPDLLPWELPPEVFNLLRSTLRHPWLFDSPIIAKIMAEIAAERAFLKGWQPNYSVEQMFSPGVTLKSPEDQLDEVVLNHIPTTYFIFPRVLEHKVVNFIFEENVKILRPDTFDIQRSIHRLVEKGLVKLDSIFKIRRISPPKP